MIRDASEVTRRFAYLDLSIELVLCILNLVSPLLIQSCQSNNNSSDMDMKAETTDERCTIVMLSRSIGV